MAAPAPAGVPGLKADSLWSRLAIHRVPTKYILVSAFVSYIILALGYLQGAPPWIAFGLALVPWGLMVFVEIEWSYKHFGWFALFGAMAFVQLIHYSEHAIEVIQVHVFHDPVHQAIAIFSSLNIEWVHFTGDTLLTIGTLVLLYKFPRNPWLWVAIPFQIAHQAEHTFLLFNYLFEGAAGGGPGLLASPGGAIAGGVGLNRPDLHFIYNTLFTVPFVLALIYQLRRTYDEALDEAFAGAPKAALIEASHHLATFTYSAGECVVAPGDDVDRLYIVVEGEAGVYAHEEGGVEREIAVLRHGQYFGEVALLLPDVPHTKTIRAKSRLTVLAMDEPTFRHLMAVSQADETQLEAMARERAGVLALQPAAAAAGIAPATVVVPGQPAESAPRRRSPNARVVAANGKAAPARKAAANGKAAPPRKAAVKAAVNGKTAAARAKTTAVRTPAKSPARPRQTKPSSDQ